MTLFEYIWIDAGGNIRSKIKIHPTNTPPIWNFDGSSTGQQNRNSQTSDVIINPVRIYNHPLIDFPNSKLVLCECLNPDMTPHETNHRRKCEQIITKDVDECLFGIEQEYVIMQRDGTPYKWKSASEPGVGLQGPYYCAVGGDLAFGREISEEHLLCCLKAGVHICGTNAEVMPSQWEFQIGTCDMLTVSDDLHVARFLLHRITEKHGDCSVSFHPKLFSDWNGSGGHTNFSTKNMRESNGMSYILLACDKLANTHAEDIKVYGVDNEKRLTGRHETSDLHTFTWGKQNRNCSVRIPLQVCVDGCGYLEDRRPASNMEPYLVVYSIVKSILF